jgi:hypothetical protein
MAQQTRTTLLSNLLVLFPNNATEFITPAKLREGLTNMIDSGFITLTDDSGDIIQISDNLFMLDSERSKLGNVPVDTNQELSDLNSAIVALQGSLIPQGSWNASNNTPDITGTTETGYYWIVSDAGSTSLGGITDWEVNDWAIKTATGWAKVDNTDSVLTVAGRTGNIVLAISDITGLQTALDSKAIIEQVEQTSIFVKAPADGTERVILKAGYVFSITEVTTISTSGTCTLAVSINGLALGGSANAVSTSEVSEAHSTDNAVSIGDDVEITVSSNSSCENLSISLTGIRNLA